jgi:hypothetical protein
MSIAEFDHYYLRVITVTSFTGAALGVYFNNRLNTQSKKIAFFLFLMLIMDFLSWIIGHVLSNNNMIVLHIYSFTELAFMIYFYKKHMFRNKQFFLTILGIAGLVYIVSEMLLIFVFKGLVIKEFSPLAKVVDNFIIILFALAFLSEKMNRYREMEWGNFRLNIVFLVFYTLSTFFFLPFNFMINAIGNVKFYFSAGHITLLILYYLYLTIEILRNGLKGAPASSGLRK